MRRVVGINVYALSLLIISGLAYYFCSACWRKPSSAKFPHGPLHLEQRQIIYAEQIGQALKLYASDHAGFLPDSLSSLVPRYLSMGIPINEYSLLVTNQYLFGLAPEHIIVRGPDLYKDKRLLLIRSDGLSYSLLPGE